MDRARAMAGLVLLRVASFLLAAVSGVVVTATYGASGETDAFYFAQAMPQLAMGLVLGTLPLLLVPAYVRLEEREGAGAARRLAGFLLAGTVAAGVPLVALLGLAAPLVTDLLSGFPPGQAETAASMLALLAPTLVLATLAQVETAILNAHDRFAVPAAVILCDAAFVVGFVLALSPRWGIHALAVAYLGSIAVQWLALAAYRRRVVGRIPWRLDARGLPGLPMLAVAWPLVVSQAVGALELFWLRYVATTLPERSLSVYNLAAALVAVGYATFAVSMGTSLLPLFSRFAAREDRAALRAEAAASLRRIGLVVVPVAVLLGVFAEPGVRLLYERGSFDRATTLLTASVLAVLAVGLVPQSAHHVVSRVFLSMGDSRTPTAISVAVTAVTVPAAYALARLFGIAGLAAAPVLSAACVLGVGVLVLRRRGLVPELRAWAAWIALHAVLALAAAAAAADLWDPWAAEGTLELALRLGACALTVGILYLAGAAAAREPDVLWLARRLRRRIFGAEAPA